MIMRLNEDCSDDIGETKIHVYLDNEAQLWMGFQSDIIPGIYW